MTWLTWRLQRTELVLLGLIILALGGSLLLTYADFVATTTFYTAETCPVPLTPSGTEGAICIVPVSQLFELVMEWLQWFNVLPLVAAVLLALPIVIELERGTYRLAWTQSVTRGRWVRTKFAVVSLGGLGFAALFALAFHWWSAPSSQHSPAFDAPWYDLRGTLPIGYTLFAIGLMLAIGALARRPILTIMLAAIAYAAVFMPIMTELRPQLLTPVTRPSGPGAPGRGDLVVFQGFQDTAGNLVSYAEQGELCANAQQSKEAAWQCVADNGLIHVTSFQPASRYWPLQLIETGIYLAAGLALLGFAAWYVMRRVE